MVVEVSAGDADGRHPIVHRLDDVVEEIIRNVNPGINRELEITQEEYARRWEKVQEAMKERGYDLAYTCGSELGRSDVARLAGIFYPIIERYGILVPSEGKPVVVAGSEGGPLSRIVLRSLELT